MNVMLIAGSNRKEAISTSLSEYVASLISSQGHQTTVFDLYKKPLPFYSPDGEYSATDTDTILELHQEMKAADAIVLATPEYHCGISGVLKNALDHLNYGHFHGKVVLSMSSAGGAAGTRSLQQLQAIVRNLHGINLPDWVSIGGEQHDWFKEPQILYRVQAATRAFLDLADRVR